MGNCISVVVLIVAILMIVERHLILMNRGRAVSCAFLIAEIIKIVLRDTACLEHLSLVMFLSDNIKQFTLLTVELFEKCIVTQTAVLLHELLALFGITLDVLGELFDLAIVLSNLFDIHHYGYHLASCYGLFRSSIFYPNYSAQSY